MQPLSAFVAREVAILSSVGAAFREVWNVPHPSAMSYTEAAQLRALVFALPVMLGGDLMLVHIFVHPLWRAVLLDAVGLYGTAWILGLFGSMCKKPHVRDGDRVLLHRGELNSICLNVNNIESATPLGAQRGFGRVRNGVADLFVGGVPAVELRLREPIEIKSMGRRNLITCLRAPSDKPGDFCAELRLDKAPLPPG